MDAILAYSTALGISAASGLNAWIPLLCVGLLSRYTGFVDLDGPWDVLQEWWMLGLLAVIGTADFVGDKIPTLDHALHAVGAVIAPLTGTIAALASTDGEASPVLVAVVAIITAEFTHSARAAFRGVSTVGTAGIATPVVSAVEDTGSVGLSLVGLTAPLVAAVIVLAGAAGALFGGKALWTRWRASRRAPEPGDPVDVRERLP